LAAALMLFTFSSCKKDNSDIPKLSKNTISAKVDGTLTTFNIGAAGAKLVEGSDEISSFSGASADGTVMSITFTGALNAGRTFTNSAADENDKPLVIFLEKDGTTFLNGEDTPANALTVTITSISGNQIKGTFSGRLVEAVIGNDDPPSKVITEGKFDVTLEPTKIGSIPPQIKLLKRR
jgi:hypothetical protein